jgi:tRNA(Ile)-lysidine synthase TilS/MesJ
MKTVLGCLRRADQDFHMIQSGDRIAVGVSGGKDSLLLLYALSLYRKFSHMDYELHAFTVAMCPGTENFSGVQRLCDTLNIPYTIRETEIAHILFDIRKDANPCALCAKMRKGILNELAAARGLNKLALGHHREDALETLLMSLLFESRLHTFHPVTHFSRANITAVRPLVYLPEKHVIHMAKVLDLPVVASSCPANGHTKRQEMKELLRELTGRYPRAPEYMLNALKNDRRYGLWDKPK